MKLIISKNEIPDAIFCFNDPTAFGVIKALKEAGLSCPKDVALVGFSETEVAELIDPPLTSIEQPTFEIGETAAKILLDQIRLTPPPEAETVCLNAKLNIRKSSENLRNI
jgi:LacI family transcriptional regulator